MQCEPDHPTGLRPLRSPARRSSPGQNPLPESCTQGFTRSHDLVCLIRNDHGITDARLSIEDFCRLEHLQVRDGSRSQEMYEAYLVNMGIERNIVLQMSHYMSIAAIIERSDPLVVLPRTVSNLYARHSAIRLIEPPVEIPPYSLKHHWHARYQKDPRHVWLRAQIWEIFGDHANPQSELKKS